MAIYRRGRKWYVDYYHSGKRERKAVGSREEVEAFLADMKVRRFRGELTEIKEIGFAELTIQ